MKFFGITITIDLSWILIFLLITFNLALGVFPTIHPQWSPLLNWLISIIASLLLFASVLVHEIAHSIVARTQGIPISQITLFLFGGVANVDKEPQSPFSEFIIAIVGPLTSLILGIIFLALGFASTTPPFNIFNNSPIAFAELSPLSTLFLWLGPINISLAIFNLIPGFPLDGGRVFRSIIWALSHNLEKSTKVAASFGQGIAWLFIVMGISLIFGVRLPYLGGGLLNGIWLVFIGWFLNYAASQSYHQMVVSNALQDTSISQLMRRDLPIVQIDLPIRDLVNTRILGEGQRAFLVMKQDTWVGLVTLEDVHKVNQQQWEETTVQSVMIPVKKVITISTRDNLDTALRKLTETDIGQLPVLHNRKLAGILYRRDILVWLELVSKEEEH